MLVLYKWFSVVVMLSFQVGSSIGLTTVLHYMSEFTTVVAYSIVNRISPPFIQIVVAG